MNEPQVFFTKERREANMQLVVDQLQELTQLDFNSLVFTFADIIQSSFLNGLLIGKSKVERDEAHEKIVVLRNLVIDNFNSNSENMMHDMVVLTDLIMDGVENATQRALEDSKNI